MASLMTAETCAKLEPEDGKSLRDAAVFVHDKVALYEN